MNLEHLFKKISPHLKKKKHIRLFFFNQIQILQLKKEKLKLGSITFTIKEFVVSGFKIYETIDIKYTRQDTSKEDSLKIENRLEALKWKWTFAHVMAAFLILCFVYSYLYTNFYLFYWDLIFSNPLGKEKDNQFLTFVINNFFNQKLNTSSFLYSSNLIINEILLNFINNYKILS